MIVVWILGLVLGVAAAAVGSRRAVGAALETSEALGISAGVIGLTVMAVGTDLPEIANSIMASLTEHGDLNVGDSTGSALAQVTLVLAVLILATGLQSGPGQGEPAVAVPTGLMTVGALVVLAVLISDGMLSRANGLVLVSGWAITVAWMARRGRDADAPPRIPDDQVGRAILRTIAWLALVGLAAVVIVRSFLAITEAAGLPEIHRQFGRAGDRHLAARAGGRLDCDPARGGGAGHRRPVRFVTRRFDIVGGDRADRSFDRRVAGGDDRHARDRDRHRRRHIGRGLRPEASHPGGRVAGGVRAHHRRAGDTGGLMTIGPTSGRAGLSPSRVETDTG